MTGRTSGQDVSVSGTQQRYLSIWLVACWIASGVSQSVVCIVSGIPRFTAEVASMQSGGSGAPEAHITVY